MGAAGVRRKAARNHTKGIGMKIMEFIKQVEDSNGGVGTIRLKGRADGKPDVLVAVVIGDPELSEAVEFFENMSKGEEYARVNIDRSDPANPVVTTELHPDMLARIAKEESNDRDTE